MGIDLQIELNGQVISRVSASGLYWSAVQLLAHAASNGAIVRAGDLYASGTISGSEPGTEGSLIELTRNGERPLTIGGQPRIFLVDGDRVVLRGRAGDVALGEVDGEILPAEAGLDERAVSFTKGCYPGQEPVARLHYRGHANRTLRILDVDAPPEAEIRHGDRVVGRVTSSVPGLALAYVRTDVPDDADLEINGRSARLH